jgi:hypothetical protein
MKLVTKNYSIVELSVETGIPRNGLAALLEYYGDTIPIVTDGDRRRFPPDAIGIIVRLWRKYNSGIKEQSDDSNEEFANAMEQLLATRKMLGQVAANLRGLESQLRQRPPAKVYSIHALPDSSLELTRPLAVRLEVVGSSAVAIFDDAKLEARGNTPKAAVVNLREVLMRTFRRLEQQATLEEEEVEQFAVLTSFIRRR